jgi:hypothetical protein
MAKYVILGNPEPNILKSRIHDYQCVDNLAIRSFILSGLQPCRSGINVIQFIRLYFHCGVQI